MFVLLTASLCNGTFLHKTFAQHSLEFHMELLEEARPTHVMGGYQIVICRDASRFPLLFKGGNRYKAYRACPSYSRGTESPWLI